MDTTIELFTIKEASRILSVPESWLRKRVSARGVPHTRLGKHVRFSAKQLLQVIALGESTTATAPPSGNGLSSRARRAPRSEAAVPPPGSSASTAESADDVSGINLRRPRAASEVSTGWLFPTIEGAPVLAEVKQTCSFKASLLVGAGHLDLNRPRFEP